MCLKGGLILGTLRGRLGVIASLGKARRQGGTSITFVQVSVLGEGYRYPSSPWGLEYRYWLLSTDTSCLKTVFGTP
ncbi:hypothetical protein GQ457_04G015490 [Hibiscus cannabinus]